MKIMALLISLIIANFAFADDHEGGTHTPNYCTAESTCAHLMFPKLPSTKYDSSFLVHILPSTENAIIENLSVKLWMDMGNGHGHGSAPVKIATIEEANHFQITNAWFVMKGNWQVIINFKEDGSDRNLIIPVQIND